MKYLIIILLLTSCGATHHLKKFYKKGGKIEQVETVVTINDTIKGADGKDSIIYRELIIDCPEPIIKTRWKTRLKYKFDNKRFKDSLRFIKRMYSDSLQSAVRSNRIASRVEKNKDKQETKQIKSKYNLWLILIGLVGGFVLHTIILKVWKRN